VLVLRQTQPARQELDNCYAVSLLVTLMEMDIDLSGNTDILLRDMASIITCKRYVSPAWKTGLDSGNLRTVQVDRNRRFGHLKLVHNN
jgi:hypothetical protein